MRTATGPPREHLAAGRLTLEEFDERLDRAYAAKTLGELDDLMADLPGTDLGQRPDTSVCRSADNPPLTWQRPGSIEAGQGRFSPAWRAAWVLARDQPLRLRDLAGQRGQWRPVVLVGGPSAGSTAPWFGHVVGCSRAVTRRG